MNPKLRTALLLAAALSIAVALYYPITQFFENKTIDDEMDALRLMRMQGAKTGVLPKVDMPGTVQGSALSGFPRDEETDRSKENPDSAVSLAENADAAQVETPRALETPKAPEDAQYTAEKLEGQLGKEADAFASIAKSGDLIAPGALPMPGESAVTSGRTVEPETSAFSASHPVQQPEATPFVFDEDRILPEYKPMYEENPDLIGWLKIPGTVIDYPVLQREDEAYYLTRDFYGRDNKNGQLILDAQCDPYTPSANLVISGHNMKSGKMFGALMNYASRSFGKTHSTIEFDTLFEKGQYKLVAAFYAWDYEKYKDGFQYNADFRYRIEMIKYLEELGQVKLYDTGVDVEFGDTIITLSTCSYQTDEGRFVVVARRIREGENP